jgi:hypothetical protein
VTRPRSPYRPGTSSIWQWIGGAPGHTEKPSPQALADLKRRKALGPRADLTGRMLGDPPPGRSALDRKLEAERRAREALEALAAKNEDQA